MQLALALFASNAQEGELTCFAVCVCARCIIGAHLGQLAQPLWVVGAGQSTCGEIEWPGGGSARQTAAQACGSNAVRGRGLEAIRQACAAHVWLT